MKKEKGNQNNNGSIKRIKTFSLNNVPSNIQNNQKKKYLYKTISFSNDLKYTTNNNNDNNKSKKKLITSLSSDQFKEIQNDIISLGNLVKNKKQKSNKKISRSEISIQNHNKRNIKYNENKYEMYNKENLAYEIYHDYKKLNFNDENIPFLKRMELYSIKRNLKEEKINELLNLRSPKISEERRKKTFNNLIRDIKIRKEKKEKKEISTKSIEQKKKVSHKKINEIVKRLYTSKHNLKTKKNINTDVEKEIVDNKNLSKENKKINKCNSQKNFKTIKKLNQRLYYKYMNEKDLIYKLFLEKVDKLLNKKNNNKSNDNFSEDKTKYNNRKTNLKKKKIEYNFNNDNNNDIINNIKNYQFNNNSSLLNNYNIMKNDNNSNMNGSELNYLPKKENNLKISLIIDNFFSNK